MFLNYQLLSALIEPACDLYPPLKVLKGKPESRPKPTLKPKRPKFNPFFWLLLVIIPIFVVLPMVYQAWTFEEATVQQPDGSYELNPDRQAKYDDEMERLRNAQQYVLLAGEPGWYPCYSCIDTNFIYLNVREVWRYGVTRHGQQGRYRSGLPDLRLFYQIQFRGTWQLCLEEEKRKIYSYPMLRENLQRGNRLVRPPGNKQDN